MSAHCPTCGGWLTPLHVCKLCWLTRFQDKDAADATRTYADTAQEAAEKFAEHRWRKSGDYDMDDIDVLVRPAAGGDWQHFRVEIRTDVMFYAQEVKPKKQRSA